MFAQPQAPKLFDVMPSAELRQALKQSLPEGTKLVWKLAGTLAVTDGALLALDAGSLDPRYLKSESKTLPWPYPQAEFWLQCAEEPDGHLSRVYAALVAEPLEANAQERAGWQKREVACMAIDSATAAVGDRARMFACCRLGGPHSGGELGRGSVKGAEKQEREKLASWLAGEGFPNKVEEWHDGSSSVKFVPGLTEEQAAAANQLLQAHGHTDAVRIYDAHTTGEVSLALVKSLLTQLDDGNSPFLFAFQTGFGDGMYFWDALECDGRLCGYLCNFVPTDEQEQQEAVAEVVPPDVETVRVFPADLAPPLLPGNSVAVRYGGVKKGWFLATLVAETSSGFQARGPSGTEFDFVHADVVPIPNQPVFKPGDEVLAHWKDGVLQAGVIAAISSAGYSITWQRGYPPQVVPLGQLTFLKWTT